MGDVGYNVILTPTQNDYIAFQASKGRAATRPAMKGSLQVPRQGTTNQPITNSNNQLDSLQEALTDVVNMQRNQMELHDQQADALNALNASLVVAAEDGDDEPTNDSQQNESLDKTDTHPETHIDRHTSLYILSRYQPNRSLPIDNGIDASRMGDEQKYGGGGYEYPREGTRANTEPTYEYEYPREGTRANTEPTYGYDRSKTGNAGKQQKHASVLGLSELSRD